MNRKEHTIINSEESTLLQHPLLNQATCSISDNRIPDKKPLSRLVRHYLIEDHLITRR